MGRYHCELVIPCLLGSRTPYILFMNLFSTQFTRNAAFLTIGAFIFAFTILPGRC